MTHPKSAIRNRPSAIPQPLAEEILASLLEFIQLKFYPGHPVAFAKDKPRLLQWVILWPAAWLQTRGVTLPGDRYRSLLQKILLEALAHASQAIVYLPAWMRNVIQSHFRHHGDEIYDEAKAMRNQIEHALMVAGRPAAPAPDPIAQLAAAKRLLLTAAKGKKAAPKPPVKAQLSLL